LLGGFHDVAHLSVDDATDDEITAAFLRQFAVLLLDGPRRVAPDPHLATQLLFRQQPRVQPVVEVVAVVGDFVTQICHLRLQRSGPGLEPTAVARMVVTGLVFGQSLADFPRQIQPGKSGIFLLQLLDDA